MFICKQSAVMKEAGVLALIQKIFSSSLQWNLIPLQVIQISDIILIESVLTVTTWIVSFILFRLVLIIEYLFFKGAHSQCDWKKKMIETEIKDRRTSPSLPLPPWTLTLRIISWNDSKKVLASTHCPSQNWIRSMLSMHYYLC